MDVSPAPVTTTGQPLSQASGTPVPQNALLVTSGAARTATTNNVSNLQQATSGLIPQQTDEQRANAIKDSGGQQPAPGGTTINIGGGYKPGESQPDPTKAGQPGYDVFGNAVASNGTDSTQNGGGSSSSTTTTTSSNADAVKGIKDPAIASQYKSALDALDQQATVAGQNLEAAKATLANDPAAAAAVDSIIQKYSVLLQGMKDKNAIVIGRANSSVAAFGGLGQMSQNFLSDQQDRASQRIADLVAQEQDLILKATIAYKSNDVKALNTAMDAYDKANKDKLSAISKLLSETDKQVKQQQDQQKIDAAAQKQQVATDISKSNNLAANIAKVLEDSGITDAASERAYIEGMAKESGISNADILANAVTKAQQANSKAALAAKNTNSIIANRGKTKPTGASKPGKDGSYTYTSDDISAYSDLLNKGGTGPDGTVYGKRGDDKFVDPGAYTAALNDWVNNGGTPAGFTKKFPVVGNVNPASYSTLPAAVRPKAASTVSTYKTN